MQKPIAWDAKTYSFGCKNILSGRENKFWKPETTLVGNGNWHTKKNLSQAK